MGRRPLCSNSKTMGERHQGDEMKIFSMGTVQVLLIGLWVWTGPAEAGDCKGPWQRLHGYRGGDPCGELGLNSGEGTCRPGQQFETLCDDRKGGEYRICQGPRRCGPPPRDGESGFGQGPWDLDRRRHGPEDDYRRGWVPGDRHPRQRDRQDCRYWDFHYNQPCPPGYLNFDCRGGCERR